MTHSMRGCVLHFKFHSNNNQKRAEETPNRRSSFVWCSSSDRIDCERLLHFDFVDYAVYPPLLPSPALANFPHSKIYFIFTGCDLHTELSTNQIKKVQKKNRRENNLRSTSGECVCVCLFFGYLPRCALHCMREISTEYKRCHKPNRKWIAIEKFQRTQNESSERKKKNVERTNGLKNFNGKLTHFAIRYPAHCVRVICTRQKCTQ